MGMRILLLLLENQCRGLLAPKAAMQSGCTGSHLGRESEGTKLFSHVFFVYCLSFWPSKVDVWRSGAARVFHLGDGGVGGYEVGTNFLFKCFLFHKMVFLFFRYFLFHNMVVSVGHQSLTSRAKSP